MKKFLLSFLLFSGIFCSAISQSVKLSAFFDANNLAVKLNWNMVNNKARTSYILLRSTDRINWTEAAKDKMFRNYTEDDLYIFNDRSFLPGKNFYRILISDANNNTVALSPIITVNTKSNAVAKNSSSNSATQSTRGQTSTITPPPVNSNSPGINNWIIYPNPARDFLKLTYKGAAELKGVVNVQIQDVTGKVVVKFRSGSKYKTIDIPITNLQRGNYFIQVSVENKIMMSQKFVKQ